MTDPKSHKQRLMDELRDAAHQSGAVLKDECIEVTDPVKGYTAVAMPHPSGWWVSHGITPTRWWPDEQAARDGLTRYLQELV